MPSTLGGQIGTGVGNAFGEALGALQAMSVAFTVVAVAWVGWLGWQWLGCWREQRSPTPRLRRWSLASLGAGVILGVGWCASFVWAGIRVEAEVERAREQAEAARAERDAEARR